MNKVTCRVCNREFVCISNVHLRSHKMTISDYTSMYPDADIGKNPQKGVPLSRENREKLSKARLQYLENLSEDEKLKQKEICAKNGRKCMEFLKVSNKAYRFTSETSKKIWTEEHRKHIKNINTGLKRTDETKRKIKENHWTRKTKTEVDDIIQRIFLKDCQLKETEKGWFTSKKTEEPMFYMSSYEFRRLNFLETNNDVVSFTTKHDIRIHYEFQGETHTYIPDICVIWNNDFQTLEEIKGFVREPEKFEAKNAAAIKWCESKRMHFQVLYEKDLEK